MEDQRQESEHRNPHHPGAARARATEVARGGQVLLIRSMVCLMCVGWVAMLFGCHSRGEFRFDPSLAYEQVATEIEYPDVTLDDQTDLLNTPPPCMVTQDKLPETWSLTLDEVIHLALAQSEVIRDAGGMVVRAPQSVPTIYDSAISETDPRVGPEAALSAFDAQFNTGIFWEKNNRAVNSLIFGNQLGDGIVFKQDLAAFQAGITKQAVTGTTFSLKNTVDYNKSNQSFNLSSAYYDAVVTAEVRHPLLQGSGIRFNRIAGPRAQPGMYNGVVLARINTDVSLADFEVAVRDLLYNVEQAYWNLYFAYRDLEAKTTARDTALATWQLVHKKREVGKADNEQESLARGQYYRFQASVIDAISGRRAGSVLAAGGVYSSERRLRSLIGLPASDGRLIRPAEEPSTVRTIFDWRMSLEEALCCRTELRRQQWMLKRRELELEAAKNFLRMRLDFVSQYRFRGMGSQLVTPRILDNLVPGSQSAFGQLLDGNHQEWQLALQLSTPVGNRIGHTAVRNAELQVSRERARYRELEKQVVNDTCSAFTELDRAYEVARANFNQADDFQRQLNEVQKKYEAEWVPLQFLNDAQARAAEANSIYHRSMVECSMAVAGIHRARGTLLDYYQVRLAEGPWESTAYLSARKQARRFAPKRLNYCFTYPRPVSQGTAPKTAPLPPTK